MNEIFALLDMAKTVRSQMELIDTMRMRLDAAERRACSAEGALVRAAERCADAVDEALAPGVSRKRAPPPLQHWELGDAGNTRTDVTGLDAFGS